jgi:hypothetical protein
MCILKYTWSPGGICSLSELRAGNGQPLRIAYSVVTGMNMGLLINNISAQNFTVMALVQLMIHMTYRALVGKSKERRPLGRPRRRWEKHIEMDL